METIESLTTNERNARIALAIAVEPGEATTAAVMAAVGAQETLRLLTSTEPVPGVDTEAAALWRDLAAPRLRPQAFQQVIDATQRHRLHVSIPGDPEWPEGFAIGGVTPPLAVGARRGRHPPNPRPAARHAHGISRRVELWRVRRRRACDRSR